MNSRISRRLAFALLPVAALTTAAVIWTIRSGDRASAQSATSTPAPQARKPPREQSTPDQAIAAAARLLYSFDLDTVLDPVRFEARIAAIAAPGRDATVRRFLGDGLSDVRLMFEQRPRLSRAAPIGYRLRSFDGRRATVSIWNVTIGGSPTVTPVAQWRTITLDLHWARNRWLLRGGRTSAGPSPATELTSLAPSEQRYREFRHVP